MNKLLLYILYFAVLLLSCSKEGVLEHSLILDNVYEISDNSDDPIHKRVFQIYNKYSVPVFFNDTIGQVFVTNDVNGNPIYTTEKIDLSWTFTGYSKHIYKFEYMSEREEMDVALDVIENYLESSSVALHPFSFFVTRSGKAMSQGNVVSNYEKGDFLISFRTVYMTGNLSEEQLTSIPPLMKRHMVLDKILNYPEEILYFSMISKPSWYKLYWNELDPSLINGWKDAEALYDDWAGAKWYTEEELSEMRDNARSVIGKFGFIKGNTFTKGLQSPSNPNDDMEDYINEILKFGPKKFEELWSAHPLVIKKFSILMDIIENKMDVEL